MKEQPVLEPDKAAVIDLEQETRFAPNGIVSRTLLVLPHLRVILFAFDAGQELTENTTTRHAWVQALQGTCEFVLSGRTHLLKPGQVVYIPPGAPHALRALERFSMVLILTPPVPGVAPSGGGGGTGAVSAPTGSCQTES
jgi:quercetin dioxygenase-like cupin family protein